MKKIITSGLGMVWLMACSQVTPGGESKIHVGGPCEGCEAIYESPVALHQLNHMDTFPGFNSGETPILVEGKVYKADGSTPASDVIIYAYHTNAAGIYPKKGNEEGWAQRHGYLRGWMKTNEKGEYRFYTTRPGSYPNSNNPQHIHVTIKEPGYNEYYIDDINFEDDPLLTDRGSRNARGGSGLVDLKMKNGMLTAERNIILGKNIPHYPHIRN